MARHTPGPWEALPSGTVCTADTGQIVADPYAGGLGAWRARAQMEADGQLIAAAPVMLDMLLELEWSGTDQYDGDWYDCCPACGGGDPNGRHTPADFAGHDEDCHLDALIATAGGRAS